MKKMTGARYIAEALKGYGVTHVFFVPAILRRTMAEMEEHTQIHRIRTNGEKAAAYMADGYARRVHGPARRMPELGRRTSGRTPGLLPRRCLHGRGNPLEQIPEGLSDQRRPGGL